MKFLKNIGISLIYIIGIILISTFILTIFNYFNIISGTALSVFKILICTISLFVGGFIIGKNSSKNGWLEGFKLSLIFLLLIVIFNYLAFDSVLSLKNILYYVIIIVSCIFGSIIGINLNKK